jgi:hypothetical protein
VGGLKEILTSGAGWAFSASGFEGRAVMIGSGGFILCRRQQKMDSAPIAIKLVLTGIAFLTEPIGAHTGCREGAGTRKLGGWR